MESQNLHINKKLKDSKNYLEERTNTPCFRYDIGRSANQYATTNIRSKLL